MSRRRKQLKWALVSLAIFVADTAAIMAYYTVAVDWHMRPEECVLQRGIHLAVPEVYCQHGVVRQV